MTGINYSKFSRFSFVLFLFVMVFGTSMPFQEDTIVDIDQIGTSNILNQAIYILLFMMSFAVLIKNIDKVFLVIAREKYLAAFLLWCLVSVFWSNNPMTSLKRLFQITTMASVSLAVLIYAESPRQILKSFAQIFFIYTVSSILLIAMYPAGAIDIYGNWRGLAVHKNHFAQIVLAGAVLWALLINSDFKFNFIHILMLIMSVVLIFGSKSSTSILTFLVLLSMSSLLYLVRIFDKIGVSKFYLFVSMNTICGIAISIYYLAPELIYSAPEMFGKDLTFSGRTKLWADLFDEATKHLVLGYGYGGFWLIDNKDLISLYEKYKWMPLQGHNGYLDIFNETGLVGISLLFCMLVGYFKTLLSHGKIHFGTWFILVALIINLQESVLFNRGKFLAALFIFAYLALYTDSNFMTAPGTRQLSTVEKYSE